MHMALDVWKENDLQHARGQVLVEGKSIMYGIYLREMKNWNILKRGKKLIISIIKGEVQPEQDILVKYHGKYYKSYSSKNQDA